MERRGQSTVAVAVLIIVMLVFMIIYLLSLPPDDREALLGISPEDDNGFGSTVRVTIEVDEFFMEPDVITVDRGDRVIMTFDNVGRKNIECEVSEFNRETGFIEPDETERISFIADKRGSFDFSCSVEGRNGRVRGDLEVD